MKKYVLLIFSAVLFISICFGVTRDKRKIILPKGIVKVINNENINIHSLARGSGPGNRSQMFTAEKLNLPVEVKDKITGMKFRLIPGSKFGEKSLKPFYIGMFEVTQEEWQKITHKNPARFRDFNRNPIENISWIECQKFLEIFCKKHGVPKGTFRMPTEAEWEHACRAGTKTEFCYGDDLDSSQANFDGEYPYGNGEKGDTIGKTTAVGSYKPNAFGLYDMHGNVWEWCKDLSGSSKSIRALRGGHFCNEARYCRSVSRLQTTECDSAGFRVVLAIP